MTDDRQLLTDYVQHRSTEALGQIIERHVDFVYAAALRQTRDPAAAQDITQAVFVILAKKADRIPPAGLAGWLFNATRYCAANVRRGELRRQRHERLAAKPEIQMITDPNPHEQLIQRMMPMLDQALANLRSADREIVLLRFLQGREFQEVGSLLGISEQAARKRLTRAIERLRRYFTAHGVSVGSAMTTALAATRLKAPVDLASAALSAATGNSVPALAVADITRRAIHMMAWAKAKIAALIVGSVVITGAGGAVVMLAASPSQNPAPQATASPPNAPQSAAAIPLFSPAKSRPLAVPATAPSSSFKFEFPNGVVMELIGIYSPDATGDKSWAPDGKPMNLPPGPRFQIRLPQPAVQYQTLWRIAGSKPLPDIGTAFYCSSRGAMIFMDGQNDRQYFCVFLPKDTQTTAFSAAIAVGDWTSAAVADNPSLGTDDQAALGRGEIPLARIFPASDSPKGVICRALISVPPTDKPKDQIQIVAHTSKGDVVGQWRSSLSESGTHLMQTDILFPNIVLADVATIEFRNRPFQWVDFQNVSLDPGQITHPKNIPIPKTDPQ